MLACDWRTPYTAIAGNPLGLGTGTHTGTRGGGGRQRMRMRLMRLMQMRMRMRMRMRDRARTRCSAAAADGSRWLVGSFACDLWQHFRLGLRLLFLFGELWNFGTTKYSLDWLCFCVSVSWLDFFLFFVFPFLLSLFGLCFFFSLFGETRRLSLARCVRFLQPAGSEATTDGRRCTADFFAAGAAAAGSLERMLFVMWSCGSR